MRVLDTKTLEFREFPDLPDKPYAILSHRWGSAEITYKKYRKSRDSIQRRAGYKKVVDFCRIARQRDFRYAWVDTCCIDKRSSAELSEAINSMYRWYKESTECYVYLEDYRFWDPSPLGACEWFKRGWTLQELLAPRHCVFFTANWDVIGHKHYYRNPRCACESSNSNIDHNNTSSKPTSFDHGPNLLQQLVAATKIPGSMLTGITEISTASVARRMSWASHRSTSRIEDRAYSLLGIFDINMPLLYGERTKAFRRLQEEIIRTSNDPSIFAFGRDQLLSVEESMYERPQPMYPRKVSDTVLAESPDYFWQGGDVLVSKDLFDEPYLVTHMGLRVVTRSYKAVRPDWLEPSGICYAILVANNHRPNCSSQPLGQLYLVVQQVRSGKEGYYIRVGVESCTTTPPSLNGLDWEPEDSRLFYIKT
ncbi:hypothetical protein MBLNU13_g08297t1 [Cladosporium sp. NU13]